MLRNGQLADVVQQRCRIQRFHFFVTDLQCFSHFNRVHPHPLQVIVGGMVLGFNRKRKRLNCAQVQACHVLDMPLLVLQFSQIEPIRAVNHEDDWKYEQGSLPIDDAVQPAHQAGNSSPHQVIGK